MGDQQQKIDALRAAMTNIQERDPDAPVPDFLVVDTSVPAVTEDDEPDSSPGAPHTAPADPGSAVSSAATLGSAPTADSTEMAEDAGGDESAEDSRGAGDDQGPEDEEDSASGAHSELSPAEQYEKARAVVLRRLTGSPKSRHQLAVALQEKEFSAEIITRVLDRMEEVHLVNDSEFAQTWVKGRHELKNLGKSALRRELREKGINDVLAAEALEQITPEDEGDAARELVQRKLQGKNVPTGPSPEERAERDKITRRLVSMLARRGHAPGVAFQIVREEIDDHSNA